MSHSNIKHFVSDSNVAYRLYHEKGNMGALDRGSPMSRVMSHVP